MRLRNIVLPLLTLCLHVRLHAQDAPNLDRINKKVNALEQRLTKQTGKYLLRVQKIERQLQRKLQKKDVATVKKNFDDAKDKVYIPRLDSMQTALRFLQQSMPQAQTLLHSYEQLQNKLNQAESIKNYLKQRQQFWQQHLGVTKELKQLRKQAYYYHAQLNQYKQLLNDPSRLEAKLLQLAIELPAFKEFFAKYSMLSSVFRIPGNNPVAPAAGLQARAGVLQAMQQRFGAGPDVSRAMQQNIQFAQAQLDQLKNKVSKLGGNGSDMDMPDFKPNSQKIKSFWNRIEVGTNVQSARSNNYFPVTSDLGLSAGYKLNDWSIAGIELSYKLGWGENIRHISITHEGVGLRSFFELKLRGSFYASGGFEYNYQKPFNSITHINDWQQSGLIGISKTVAVQNKLFKKTKVQLLWDFLSYQQIPRSQPIKFRIGYSLN